MAALLLAAVVLLPAATVGSQPTTSTGKLQWVAPFNPGLELAIDLHHPLPTFQNANFGCNASLLGAAFADTKVPGFLSLENCIRTMPSFQPIWDYPTYKGTGLAPHWQTALARQLVPALPLFKSGAIAGVFLGDEMLCSKVPFSNYSAVATAVRKWLTDSGLEKSLLYSNECSTSLIVGPPATCRQGNLSGCPAHACCQLGCCTCMPDKLPVELDLFSIDMYTGRSVSTDPNEELRNEQRMVRDWIKPRLHPHQKIMLVPGLYGDRNTSRSGTMDEQEEYLMAKLEATVAWAKADPDM
jgi:hypothetical protein